MADNDRGQSLITKYIWVIETIYRKRKISFKELNELWLRDDISRGVDIPKRTFDNWRYLIWDMFGINIANEGRGEYRYYIENEKYSVFTFNLRPEFDFQQELLWNGEDMEVLEPLWLRKEIAGKIKRMWNKYKEDK